MTAAGRTRGWSEHWRRLRPLYLAALLCLIPVVASYLAYYRFPPAGRTNYGELIDPQRATPDLALHGLDGTPFDLGSLRGRWVMLTVDHAECTETCRTKLWNMRQVRTAAGKERDRVERVLLLIDDGPTTTMLLREFEGTHFLRAAAGQLEPFLLLPRDGKTRLEDCVWLIDPLGHLMLRWPPAADASRMKKDLDRLLRASRIG
ncbi:MAG TPA: SCO family protein [Burkholderiaceae bacterium]|nr:SCO family protein [Burkholderiaceae bacterium]